MALIKIELSVDECPEWLPADLLDELMVEVEAAGSEYINKLNAIKDKYEAKAKERLGRNLIPFCRSEVKVG